MPRRLIGLDYESYYDSKTFTLRKMDVPSYVCDPRFEVTLVAVKEGSSPAFTVDAPEIPRYLAGLGDPSDVTLYGHNLMFDACIASWVYNWRAGMNVCTLAIARQLLAKNLRSLSLDSVTKHLGFRAKGNTIMKVDGMRRNDIMNAGLWHAYNEYAKDDIESAYEIVQWGMPQISAEELVIADQVLRMATEPSFVLDKKLLQEHYEDVVAKKEDMLAMAMIGMGQGGKADLMSNDKFALVLQNLGVDPPTKVSLTTGKQTWAFAKSDEGMKELQEHEDPVVQAVVAARLGHKTTIEETRTERYLNIASLNFPAFGVGVFPVPLKVSGAHTHRLSSDWKLGVQNMPRGGKLRKSLRAPEGYVVVAGDLSQIEARMTAVFSGQWDLVEQFRNKLDPYSIMATKIFGQLVTKADVPRRYVGKQTVLAAQFGVGGERYYWNTKAKARAENVPFILTLEECENVIQVYRRETWAITEMRKRLNAIIPMMADPTCNIELGPVRITHGKITGPGGLALYYEQLRYDPLWGSWVFTYQGRWKRLYGGKLLENCLAENTMVLTEVGFLPIQNITTERVWDGHEFVYHDGVVCKGEQEVVELDGVWATPDHKFLTTEGWRSASSCEGYYREQARIPDSTWVWRFGRQEIPVGGAMRLRRRNVFNGERLREEPVLRVPEENTDRQSEYETRDECTPSVFCLAFNDRQMHPADTSVLGQLRWAWDNSVPIVGRVREFLGRHARYIQKRINNRTRGQHAGVPERQLQMGIERGPSSQSEKQRFNIYPLGQHHNSRSGEALGYKCDYTSLPFETRRAPVYDILNSGKRSQFVVAGNQGLLIAHNCIQFLAGRVTMQACLRLRKPVRDIGGRIALQEHDALALVVPLSHRDYALNLLEQELTRQVPWMPQLPVACEVGAGPTFGDTK